MTRTHGFSIATSGLACFALGVSAQGALVTYEFAGNITSLSGDVGFLGGSVSAGTPFSGAYTFDSDVMDMHPELLDYGHYFDALSAFSLQVGPHAVSTVGNNDELFVGDNYDSQDSYEVNDFTTQILGQDAWSRLLLADPSMTAFSSDALPLSPPALGAFNSHVLQLGGGPSPFMISGEITTLVPEPGALGFLSLGLLYITRRSRRPRAMAAGITVP